MIGLIVKGFAQQGVDKAFPNSLYFVTWSEESLSFYALFYILVEGKDPSFYFLMNGQAGNLNSRNAIGKEGASWS